MKSAGSSAREPTGSDLLLPRANRPEFAANEVHCWWVPLDAVPGVEDSLHATLSVQERARSARFRFQRDRSHYVVAHGALRDLLGRYLQAPAGAIRFVRNAFGKPDLDLGSGDGLRFNLSHSGGLALVAITPGAEVGVDLEQLRAQRDYAEIARHFLPAGEVAELDGLPVHQLAEAFLTSWTRREAYWKALGVGLSQNLDDLQLSLATDSTPDPPAAGVPPDDPTASTRWSCFTLRHAPSHVAALVVEGSGWRVREWRWEGPAPSPYSYRSACVGSMREARQAGT